MTYATQDDMVRQFGEREVIALTDRERLGVIDGVVLAAALEDASAEIDSYLVGRCRLPLAGSFPMLAIYCCDIARYRLSGAGSAVEVDVVRNRYKDAIRFLEAVRDGKVKLGADAEGQPAVQSGSAHVLVSGGRRIFSRPR